MSQVFRPLPGRSPFWLTGLAVVLIGISLAGFVLRPSATELSPRFNHVMLYVSDLEASIEFYTTAFDLEVTQRLEALTILGPDGSERTVPVRMAFLKFPGQEFVFELSEQPVTAGASPFYQHVGVDVVDLEAAAERVQAAGARNFSGIQTVQASAGIVAQNAFFTGPDGELVELMKMVEGEF